MDLGPSYKLPNNYMAFCPGYNLHKMKIKIKSRSIYPKTLNSKARLRNGKVLDTHSAQTESSLLDTRDQCTPLCMTSMICCTKKKKKKKLNHTSLFMNASFYLLNKIQICCCDKNWIGFRKIISVFEN